MPPDYNTIGVIHDPERGDVPFYANFTGADFDSTQDIDFTGTVTFAGESLGTAAFANLGSSQGNLVALDTNGKIPIQFTYPTQRDNIWQIAQADSKQEIVDYINEQTGVTQADVVLVTSGASQGEYYVMVTKPDGTYTTSDIQGVPNPANAINSITINGQTYLSINGVANLGYFVKTVQGMNPIVATLTNGSLVLGMMRATTSSFGYTQLSDSIDLNDSTLAATSKAVKNLNDTKISGLFVYDGAEWITDNAKSLTFYGGEGISIGITEPTPSSISIEFTLNTDFLSENGFAKVSDPMTQAQYDSITTKEPKTFYVITG